MRTKSVPIRSISLQKRGMDASAVLVVVVRFANGIEADAITEHAGGYDGEIFHTIHIGGLDELAKKAGQI